MPLSGLLCIFSLLPRCNRSPVGLTAARARFRSLWMIGRWPFLFVRFFGGKPKPITVPRDVIGGWYPPPGAVMSQFASCFTARCVSATETTLGNSVGAIGSWRGRRSVLRPGPRPRHGLGKPQNFSDPAIILFWSLGAIRLGGSLAVPGHDSYLVDSASSHMLVSKIKPCMSKYKQVYCETANGSLNQLSFI